MPSPRRFVHLEPEVTRKSGSEFVLNVETFNLIHFDAGEDRK